MRRLLGAILASVLLTACGGRPAPTLSPEQQRLHGVQRIARVVERVGLLVESLQTTEIALHQAGRITREDHRVIQVSLKIAAETVLDALERMKDLTQPEATRQQAVGLALRAVDRLIAEGLKPVLDAQARLELQLIASGITAILVSLQLAADAGPPRAGVLSECILCTGTGQVGLLSRINRERGLAWAA